jgi:seryl-tRNA synthetase
VGIINGGKMDNIIKDIAAIDEKNKEIITTLEQTKGAKKQVMKTLKDDYDCSTYDAVVALFNELEQEEEELRTEIEDEHKTLMEKWKWD